MYDGPTTDAAVLLRVSEHGADTVVTRLRYYGVWTRMLSDSHIQLKKKTLTLITYTIVSSKYSGLDQIG